MSKRTGSHSSGPPAEAPPIHVYLFVAGDEPNSAKAKAVLSRLESDRIEIHIVDVLEDYEAAIARRVVVVPTLIIEKPSSSLTIVGSLNDERILLVALGPLEG